MKKKEEEKKEITSIYDAFWELMEEIFTMDVSAEGEKIHISSVEIRDMFREVLDISVNEVTMMMLKKGFKISMIQDTAYWNLIKKK